MERGNIGFSQNHAKSYIQNLVFYEVIREAMLSSLAKYDKLANLKHVDSKKQLFVRGVYCGSPEAPPTSSPNRRPERRLMERVRLSVRLSFVRQSFARESFVRLSSVRQSFVRQSCVRQSFLELSFVRQRFLR